MTTELPDLTVSDVAVDVCKLIDAGQDELADITYSGAPNLYSLTVTATSNITGKSRKFELDIRDDEWDGVSNAHLVADLVLFAYRHGKQHVLLIRRGDEPFAGRRGLPGGYVKQDETFEQAARREALEETGVQAPQRLTPLGMYDAPNRDPRGRVISMVFVGTLDHMPEPVSGDDARNAEWFPTKDLPQLWKQLAFDHAEILRAALSVTA